MMRCCLVVKWPIKRIAYAAEDKGMSSAEFTTHFLYEIGRPVQTLDAAGESGGVIAAWVEAATGTTELTG